MNSKDIKVAFKACLLLIMHMQVDPVLIAAAQGIKFNNDSERVISGCAT